MTTALLNQLLQLPPAERQEVAEALWESLADAPGGQLPVPQWHQELLEQRLARLEQGGSGGAPWPEALDEIQKSA
jgi:putative addiction module component (TIGR02574 family)